jgi:hypothetical protein
LNILLWGRSKAVRYGLRKEVSMHAKLKDFLNPSWARLPPPYVLTQSFLGGSLRPKEKCLMIGSKFAKYGKEELSWVL